LKWDKATLFQKKSILTCLVFITLEVNSTFLYEIRNSKGACYFIFVFFFSLTWMSGSACAHLD
jgi:hypothetical protein